MIYTYYKQYGSTILLSYLENGVTHHKRVKDYRPSLYLKTNEDTPYKSIFGYNLKKKTFNNIKESKEYAEVHKSLDNFIIEGNANYANQFIIELNEGKVPQHNPQEIKGCILDIEVTAPYFPEPKEAKFPIDAITLFDTVLQDYTVFGLGDYDHEKDDTRAKDLNINYYKMASEYDLLLAIINYFQARNFNFTSGWNSEMFDMVYIVNRIISVLGEKYAKMLSPFGIVNIREIRGDYANQQKVDIVGLPHLDYMALYRKHIFTPRESYSLGFIASAELGDTKLSYEEEGSLANLSKNNFQKYISYNIIDVDIIRRLNESLGLFEQTMMLAYYCLSNYEDTLGTVKIWEQLIAKELYIKNMIPLFNRQDGAFREYPGGFVSVPVVGLHRWTLSEDLNSLYPHLEMQINISPETHVPRQNLPPELIQLQDMLAVIDKDEYPEQVMNLVREEVDLSIVKEYGYSMSACGQFYIKDKQGVIPAIKQDIYNNRKKFKKEMLQKQQELEDIKNEMKKRGIKV